MGGLLVAIGFVGFWGGVGLCYLGLWGMGLLSVITGVFFLYLTMKWDEWSLDRMMGRGTRKPSTDEAAEQTVKVEYTTIKKRTWLVTSAYGLFGGLALGFGLIIFAGIFAGPGTLSGEFVHPYPIGFFLFCIGVLLTLRRKKGPER